MILKNIKIYRKGMTLVEILIVISVIAFLAILAVIYLRTQIFKSYDARRKTEIKRIAIAVEEYEKDHDCYPISSSVVCTGGGAGLQPYLDRIPCDPVTGASYYYEHETTSCPKWYRIYSSLQNESDVDYQNSIGPNADFSYVYESPNAPTPGSQGGTGGTGGAPQTNFYGCFSGVCTQISWDSARPGPHCDPNFQNATCYGQCSSPSNECQAWK